MSKDNRKSNLAFVLSLTSGLLILTNSVVLLLMATFSILPAYQEETYHWYMMGEMMSYLRFSKWVWLFLIIGIASGIVVIVSSLMLRSNQKENLLWGVLIIVFSALSILSMGGFFFGFVFGILGGILTIVEM